MKKNRDVSRKRKIIYQIGIILMIIGFILFFSTFIIGVIDFGNFDNFTQKARNNALLAISGTILCSVGMVLAFIGRRGIAGSGLILDPEKEVDDLEPINRVFGRQVNDVLNEIDLKSNLGLGQTKVIKVRCQSCKHLNDEHDKFCSACGKKM